MNINDLNITDLLGKSSLSTKRLKCKTITPLLMHGGDVERKDDKFRPKSAQLRVPSLKGVIRYWYRSLESVRSEKMFSKEVELFGGAYEKALKSKLILTFDEILINTKHQEKVLPHSTKKFTTSSIPANTEFILNVQTFHKDDTLLEKLLTYVKLSFYLGGFGQRSRRGFGSIEITDETFAKPQSWLQYIQTLIEKVSDVNVINHSNYLTIHWSTIENTTHPLLQGIYFGKKCSNFKDALLLINQASHIVEKHLPGVLGTSSPRYASPIIGCVRKINNDYYPVITEVKPKYTRHYSDAKKLFFEKVGVTI